MDQPNPFASSNPSKLALPDKHHRLNQEYPFFPDSPLSHHFPSAATSSPQVHSTLSRKQSPKALYMTTPSGFIYDHFPLEVALNPCLAMDGLGVKNQKSKKQVKKPEKAGIKVVYISSPVKVKTSASEFRALVQELTGRDSDAEKYLEMNGGDRDCVESEILFPAFSTHDPKLPHSSWPWEHLDQLNDDLMAENQWRSGDNFQNYYMPDSSHVGLGGLRGLGAM